MCSQTDSIIIPFCSIKRCHKHHNATMNIHEDDINGNFRHSVLIGAVCHCFRSGSQIAFAFIFCFKNSLISRLKSVFGCLLKMDETACEIYCILPNKVVEIYFKWARSFEKEAFTYQRNILKVPNNETSERVSGEFGKTLLLMATQHSPSNVYGSNKNSVHAIE